MQVTNRRHDFSPRAFTTFGRVDAVKGSTVSRKKGEREREREREGEREGEKESRSMMRFNHDFIKVAFRCRSGVEMRVEKERREGRAHVAERQL